MSKPDTPDGHITQTGPREWRAVGIDSRTLIVRSVPEGVVEAFIVSTVTRNLRHLARADAVLYEGDVVEPHYDDETHTVEFYHDYAGRLGRHVVSAWLDEPAVRLKRLPGADLGEVLQQ